MATASARPTPSLRHRLILGITLTAALAAFAEALLLHVVWYGYEERLIDRVVLDELRRSLAIHEHDPTLAYPNTGDLTLYVASNDPGAGGDAVPPHLRPLLDEPAPPGDDIVIREVRGDDGLDYHVGVAHRGPRTFLLVYDAREHEERRTNLLWALTAIAVLLTLIASRIALGMVDRLLGGLSRLQRRVADGPGEAGFREPGMDVEVAALADALDDQRAQVVASLRKERAFAAAASHELRTPLTRIATGADVLLARADLPGATGPRLRSIRESVDELQRMLDVLLRVARWQPGGDRPMPLAAEGAPRALGAIVDACVARLATETRLLGTSISIALDAPGRPVAHPAMLEVVLSNLLRNAVRHGRGAPVEVRERDALLEVIDAGPGIAAPALDRVFDPFWRGAPGAAGAGDDGHGLGLTIAERICAAAGWTLSIDSGPGRGTRASVRLAPAADTGAPGAGSAAASGPASHSAGRAA
jgi:signal transduction histidine kinase